MFHIQLPYIKKGKDTKLSILEGKLVPTYTRYQAFLLNIIKNQLTSLFIIIIIIIINCMYVHMHKCIQLCIYYVCTTNKKCVTLSFIG